MKLKKGDQIKVLKGKDAGKVGNIERVFSKENKILAHGVNQYKRHMKARMQGQSSEIVTITKPLPVSQVTFVCPHCQKASRIGYKIEKGNKMRVCKKCGKNI